MWLLLLVLPTRQDGTVPSSPFFAVPQDSPVFAHRPCRSSMWRVCRICNKDDGNFRLSIVDVWKIIKKNLILDGRKKPSNQQRHLLGTLPYDKWNNNDKIHCWLVVWFGCLPLPCCWSFPQSFATTMVRNDVWHKRERKRERRTPWRTASVSCVTQTASTALATRDLLAS